MYKAPVTLRAIPLVLLLAAGLAHAVLPDAPKPKPAAPEGQRQPAPAPDPMKAIMSKFDMAGEWSIEGTRRDRSVLRGVLKLTGERGAYRGSLTWSHHATGFAVRQEAVVSVSGQTVTVECSNPEILSGRGPYHADQFELQVVESRILRGSARDARGSQGTVLMMKK